MNILKPHVSLNVSNIEASVAFYEKAFGVQATKRQAGYAKFDLSEPHLDLTIQEAPRAGLNASHFGIQVASTEDVAAATARFSRAGLDRGKHGVLSRSSGQGLGRGSRRQRLGGRGGCCP